MHHLSSSNNEGLTIVTRARRLPAIAMALAYMADREPFRSTPLGAMTQTIIGAVDRGHYGFVLRGKRVVGFACYALSTEESALAWLERGVVGTSEDGKSGDVVVMIQAAFDDRTATVAGLRHLAWLYPGQRWVQKRNARAPIAWGRFPRRRHDIDASRRHEPPAGGEVPDDHD